MKISRFIAISCFSLIVGGLSYQPSSYGQKINNDTIITQKTNDSSLAIESKGKEIINFFFAKQFDAVSQSFTPQLRSEVSVEYMKRILDDTTDENGKFQKLTDSKVINTLGSDLVVLTLNFENKTEDWIIIFNDKQEIVGIDIPSQETIDEIAKEFINSLAKKDFVEARGFLHPFLKEDIFPQQVQSRWENFIKNKGEFQKISNIKVRQGSSIDNTSVVSMNLEFTKESQQLFLIFDNSKNIIGVDFVE
jgi:Protein of unknown function (DUF3887)